jgi:hypothetical protein
VRTRIGAAIWSYDRASTERCAAELRARLGDVAFAAAREAGRGMALDEAIAYALDRDRRQVASAAE